MTTAPLSAAMAAAVAETVDRGGVLHRQAGGYWTPPGAAYNGRGYEWYVPTTTINGLVRRGYMEFTEFKPCWRASVRTGQYPVAAKITERART